MFSLLLSAEDIKLINLILGFTFIYVLSYNYFAQFVLPFLCFGFPLVLCDSWLQGHLQTDILLLDIQGIHNCLKDAWPWPFMTQSSQDRFSMVHLLLDPDSMWLIYFWFYFINALYNSRSALCIRDLAWVLNQQKFTSLELYYSFCFCLHVCFMRVPQINHKFCYISPTPSPLILDLAQNVKKCVTSFPVYGNSFSFLIMAIFVWPCPYIFLHLHMFRWHCGRFEKLQSLQNWPGSLFAIILVSSFYI